MYSFKVRAINEKGYSDYSEAIWIKTQQIDTIGEIKATGVMPKSKTLVLNDRYKIRITKDN